LFVAILFGGKDSVFFGNASVFAKKKEAGASFPLK
jgi:hypothetical protein